MNHESIGQNESGTVHTEGQFTIGHGYPGCRQCKAASVFRWGCGKVGCWDGVSPTVKCPGCDQFETLQGTIESLNVAEDC